MISHVKIKIWFNIHMYIDVLIYSVHYVCEELYTCITSYEEKKKNLELKKNVHEMKCLSSDLQLKHSSLCVILTTLRRSSLPSRRWNYWPSKALT